MLLWLWCRPVAIALIRPLTWERPYAAGAALKRSKKKRKEKERKAHCVPFTDGKAEARLILQWGPSVFKMPLSLQLTSADPESRGFWAVSGDILIVTIGRSGWKPGMQLITLQCTWQSPPPENHPALKASSAEFEKRRPKLDLIVVAAHVRSVLSAFCALVYRI